MAALAIGAFPGLWCTTKVPCVVQLAPSVNRAGVHIENRCDLQDAVAFLPQLNGLLSQLLLDFGLEGAGIDFFHAQAISHCIRFVYIYLPG